MILTEAIKDPEGMKAYGQAARTAMGGATVLAVDTAPKVIEGSWHGDQTVVLEFESVDAARAWYESEGYQKAAKLRQAAADCNAVIIARLLELPLLLERDGLPGALTHSLAQRRFVLRRHFRLQDGTACRHRRAERPPG